MPEAGKSSKVVLVAVSDIFFYTKIRDALLPRGYVLERVRSQDEVHAKAMALALDAVILNMNDEKLDAFLALTQIRQDSRVAALPVLAFANHEEADTWKLAREMGITKIVSRNEFSARTLALIEEVTGRQPSAVSHELNADR